MKIIDKITAQQGKPFYSLEFFPPKEKDNWGGFIQTVKELEKINPLFASVTYGAGGGTQENTLEITAKVKNECKMETMAHLTCVGADKKKISDFLSRLKQVGVTNILALRGDVPSGQTVDWDKADFKHASDMVAFVKKEFPDFGISVAAYPAPHPEALSFKKDRLDTALKMRVGSDFAVTQLFFDVREYFSLVDDLKALGINMPIIPGVLPIQSLDSIRRILSLSGSNIPGKLYLSLEEAQNKGGVEAVKEAGLKFAIQQIRSLLDGGAPGIHLYTLNRSSMCLNIAEEVGALS
ncbi:methylenetetrahydrofolate reductase [Desulfovibrio litoralis]|uniref:Methylenetetrahydrofolate reductase n=1 Tax=Desulfovibrio litoralis DSM 11393 TaxID=1121455 RepID=A0A1M7SL14_9BACT|nr:methylenetetrahydrofolate reductase [Desulfovibrio litoralis]SHN59157.1 5,10-methylenetetrahydrofolate reductase (NAD(P)) [Desulfovibrio litoralis DSM 11393]